MSTTESKNILLFSESEYLSECYIRLIAECINSVSNAYYQHNNIKEYCFHSNRPMKFIFMDLKANWSVNEQQNVILKYKYIDAIIFCLPKDITLLNGWINYVLYFLPSEAVQNASYIVPYHFARSNQAIELPRTLFKINNTKQFYFHMKIIESLPFQYRYTEMDWENTRNNCNALLQYLEEQERYLLQVTIFGVTIRKFDEFYEILVDICLVLHNNVLGIESNSKKISQSILLEKLVPVNEFIILCEDRNCSKLQKPGNIDGEECTKHSNIVNWKQSSIFSKPLGTCIKCHCSVTKHRCLPYRKILACVVKSYDSLAKFTNERDLVLEAISSYSLYKKQKFNQFFDVFEEIINSKIDSQPYKQLKDIYEVHKLKVEAEHSQIELEYVHRVVDSLKGLEFTGETITKICPGALHELFCLTSRLKELHTANPAVTSEPKITNANVMQKSKQEIMKLLQGVVQEFKEEFGDLKKICRLSEQTMQGTLSAVNILKMEQITLNSEVQSLICSGDKFEFYNRSKLDVGSVQNIKENKNKLRRRKSI